MRNGSMVASNPQAVLGLLAGAVIGAGIALLLAPATGPDARRKVGELARRWGGDLKDMVKERLGREQAEFQTKSGQDFARMEPAAPRSSY